MQTERLRALVGPRQTEVLMDSFASSWAMISRSAFKQRDVCRLPLVLQNVAERATESGQTWTAWMDCDNAWLFVGSVTLDRARERGQPVLELQCYDTARRRKTTIVSTRLVDGSWQTCAE